MEKLVQKWRAFDGKEFETAEAADAYEGEQFQELLVGLSHEELDDALKRKPDALAISDALEKAGSMVAKARRESGDLRRKPKTNGETAGEPPATGATATEPEQTAA